MTTTTIRNRETGEELPVVLVDAGDGRTTFVAYVVGGRRNDQAFLHAQWEILS